MPEPSLNFLAVTLSRWPCVLHSSFISQIERGELLLFEKSRENFLGGVVYLSRVTHHSYYGLWVVYTKLINGLIAAASGALVC